MNRSKKLIAAGILSGVIATTPILIEGESIDPSLINRNWNVDHILQDDGSIQASFKQRQINYYDDGQWETIRTDFDEKLTHYRVDKAPFIVEAPKHADGEAKFIANNEWDLLTGTEIQEEDIEMKIKAIGTDHVRGEFETGDLGLGSEHQYIVYKDAYPDLKADLIYYVHQGVVPELRKIVRFNEPVDNAKLSFEIEYSQEIETKQEGGDIIITKKDGDSRRVIDINNLYAWDQWQNKRLIDFIYKGSGKKFTLTKELDQNSINGLNYPFYTDASLSVNPDANVETSSVDGYIGNEPAANETWSNIIDGDGTSVDDSDSILQVRITAGKNSGEYSTIAKAKVLFDTSSIGAGHYVDSADFNITPSSSSQDDFGMSMSLVSATTASNTSLAVGDFDLSTLGSTILALDKTMASMTDDVEFTMALNAIGLLNINMEGVSKFGLIPDGEPTWYGNADSRLILYSAESANDPSLDITYFAIPASKKIIPLF